MKSKNSDIRTKTTDKGNEYKYNRRRKSLCKIQLLKEEEFTIPEDLIEIEEEAFSNSFYHKEAFLDVSLQHNVIFLKKVVISKGISRIDNKSFNNCFSLESITVEEGNEDFSHIDGVLFNLNQDVLRRYPEGKQTRDGSYTVPEGVVTIQNCAFYNCSSLSRVTIGDKVTRIGIEVFSGCSSLTEINVDINNPSYCSDEGVLFTKDKKELLAYPAKKDVDCHELKVCSVVRFSGLARSKVIDFRKNNTTYRSEGRASFKRNKKKRGVYLAGKNGKEYRIPPSVTSIGDHAFENCRRLSSVDIPPSVTSIGDHAFENCRRLSSVDIPSSVTSIGNSSFKGCSSLSSLVIPTSVESIGKSAFQGCSSLSSVEIPSSVKSIGDSSFKGCSSLSSLVIPTSVTHIKYSSFSGCSSLSSLVIPTSVESIGNWAFEGCSSLSSVEIPSSVKSIGDSSFKGCSSLSSVEIPPSVTKIQVHAFAYCSSLTRFFIPSSVTDLDYSAFRGCSSLTEIEVDENNPEYSSIDGALFTKKDPTTLILCPPGRQNYSIPSGVEKIEERAFCDCSSLTKVFIPSSVTYIDFSVFRGCSSLTEIEVDDRYSSINGALFTDDQKTLFFCPPGRQNYSIPPSVTRIGNHAFDHCSSLSSVEIPSSVESIGYRAFAYCSSLTRFFIPSSVTDLDHSAFRGCSSLTEIEVDENNPEYSSIDGALFTKKDPTTLILCPPGRHDYAIPPGVTSIGGGAFSNCSSLKSIDIPSSVTSIGGSAFAECSSLLSVCIPSGVTYIAYKAFEGCSSLSSVVIEGDVKRIEDEAFAFCFSLSSVEIPSSVESIGYRAFRSCTSLSSVEIPPSVESIEESAFSDCSTLSSLVIPDGVTSIGRDAFNNCSELILRVPKGSYAEQYAKENKIKYEIIE